MESLIAELERLPAYHVSGRVVGIQGLLVEIAGLHGSVTIGSRCDLAGRNGAPPARLSGSATATPLPCRSPASTASASAPRPWWSAMTPSPTRTRPGWDAW